MAGTRLAPLFQAAEIALRLFFKATRTSHEEADSAPGRPIWLVPCICLGALVWVGVLFWIFS